MKNLSRNNFKPLKINNAPEAEQFLMEFSICSFRKDYLKLVF